jgi:hypothetical protein
MAAQDLFVEEFKSQLFGGGARNNYFKATLTGLDTFGGADLATVSFLCKAASLPGSTIAGIEVPFRGRVIKVAGDRTFEPWNVTIINDIDFQVRGAIERWMNAPLNTHETNLGEQRPAVYKTQMKVEQLDKAGTSLKTYHFIGTFPSVLDPIEVSYDSSNTIEEFNVTFEYDYWTSDTTDGGTQ